MVADYSMSGTHYCFNTASGMDCMQSIKRAKDDLFVLRFNTASGMDCMQ